MADNNIIIKITSEADLTTAQKQLKELTDRAKEQEQALKELTVAEKEDAQSIEDLGISGDRLNKRLEENSRYYEELRNQKKDDINETEKSIAELNKQIETYKTLGGQQVSMDSQLQELTDRLKKQKQELKDLTTLEKEDAQSIKDLGISGDRLNKALKENSRYYEELRNQKKGDIDETKKSITEINKQAKAYKTLSGQSGSMVKQLRAMREQLQRMEEGGEFGTQAFLDLSVAAGKLETHIGHTQQRISVLASDTKEIDAVLGLGDGLAGTFYVATSAVELFGGDMEGLQQAFYKVQAAMSIVSGTQQIFNALHKDSAAMVVLNTALTKLLTKAKTKNAAATGADAAASAADTAAKGAQTAATTSATTAQWSLNAAMAANPLGVILAIIIATVAAIAALSIGIVKLVHYFSDAGEAERDYAAAAAKLEEVEAENAVGAAQRAYDRQQQIKATNDAEEKALEDAKKRNASDLELAQIKANYAKQRADEAQKYSDEEIERNEKEVAELEKMVASQQRAVNAYKDGSKEKKEAQEKLNEVEQKYYDALQKGKDIEQEATDAKKEAKKAEEELAAARQQLQKQLQQTNLDLMKEGAAKEIAQIRLNYKEQLATIQGSSEEEVKLQKALLAKQAKEIAAVRKKYAQQAQQTAIQEQKNLLEAMAQSNGTEADYAQEVALTKKIAEAEAQAKIDALDKESMSERAYQAEVEAIRLDLAKTISDIDNQEMQRATENAQRRTEIEVQLAEARKNALTGAESKDTQKAVVEDYYKTVRKQIEENADAERQVVEQSTDTEEVKADKIKQINAKMNADILANDKEAAQARIDIDSQHLAGLERNATLTAEAVSNAQGLGKLDALRANLDAQTELYTAQLDNLKSQFDAGLITFQDYKQQEFDITKEIADAEAEYQSERMQTVLDAFSTVLDTMQGVSDIAFEVLGNNVQAQLDALDEEYTTDAEEAKKNADKKYISEAEYEKKKAALEMKQAKYAKAQALVNAGIAAAQAIIMSLAQSPVAIGIIPNPVGIASLALATAMGAAQIAAIAAKPLAQYAKGRKGGQGEYALVGEKGAEIMYVPQGASIIPHNKIDTPAAWGDYGVPQLAIPATANIDPVMLDQAVAANQGQLIDYERLGKAVAKAMPKQHAVNVNVDRSGVTVQSGNDTHKHLNAKYNAQW